MLGLQTQKGRCLVSRQEEILRVLAPGLRTVLRSLSFRWDEVDEIRLRVGQPLAVTLCGRSEFVRYEGRYHHVTMEEIRDTMDLLSSFSRYAFEDKIRQGFLTIQGGHRVGLAGRVILEQTSGKRMVKTIAPITFLNIRVARQVIGCGEAVLPLLLYGDETEKIRDKFSNGKCDGQISGTFYDTLLISPPGMGKTTLLRDLIRILSYGGITMGVVDERSELAACHQGIPQNDLGPRTDVLDGSPKAEGLMMMVRTMSPQILALDEVGSEADHCALEYAMHCGCGILATVHGSSWEEIRRRPILGRWLAERRFSRYVFIEKEMKDNNRVYGYRVCDGTGRVIAFVQSKNEWEG